MRVRVFPNWQANSVEVYVFDGPLHEAGSAYPTHLHRHVEGDVWRIEEAGEPDPYTGRTKPSLSLPNAVVDALLEFVRNEEPGRDRNDAVVDARKIRDRLLTLVEESMKGKG